VRQNPTLPHSHNEKEQTALLIEKLKAGQSIALVSDAGTPLISDPGYSLVHTAIENHISVVPVPGSCAFVTALAASGLPTDRFYFAGFLVSKATARVKQLQEMSGMTCTLIFYESKHRIIDSLQSMADVFGSERYCVIGRELTKKFESFYYGPLVDIIQTLQKSSESLKGEFVVLIQGKNKIEADDVLPEARRIFTILNADLPPKQAAKLAAEITGEKKNKLYKASL
jgi:16S rRNA (cytidine1402-2'-O)-methyltransferase